MLQTAYYRKYGEPSNLLFGIKKRNHMRLKEIENILSEINFEDIQLSIEGASNSNQRTLKNINNFKWFLEKIEPITIYGDEINELSESEIFRTAEDSLQLNVVVAREIYFLAKYIFDSSSSLVLVFKKLLPNSNDHSIGVKLPEPSDFEDLVKTMSTLQKSISQVVAHKDIEGSIKINNWEFGSFWVDLFLGTQAAVAVVSSIAWSAAVVSKKFNENKVLETTIRAMEIKNESLEDILESQKEMTRILVESETNLVIEKHFTDKEPEHFARVKSTIKTFAKLIQDGAEIHPSLMAPEDVKNLFPNYKKIESITSKIKLIEKLPEDNEETND